MRARRHAEHEERCAHAELVEQPQQGVGLALERRPRARPVGRAQPPAHQLVPVLEIDA